jgi:hypothetical protein
VQRGDKMLLSNLHRLSRPALACLVASVGRFCVRRSILVGHAA